MCQHFGWIGEGVVAGEGEELCVPGMVPHAHERRVFGILGTQPVARVQVARRQPLGVRDALLVVDMEAVVWDGAQA